MKSLIATGLVLTALNTNATGVLTDFTTIQTQPNLIQEETYDQNNDLQIGKYYAIKDTNNFYLNIGGQQIYVKGYQYTYIDTQNESKYQIIDYYILAVAITQYTFNSYEFLFNGNTYTVQDMQPYYEEYALQYKTTSDEYLNAFFNNRNINFSLLETLRTQTWQNLPNTNHEVYNNTAYLQTDQKYSYYRFRIRYEFDGDNYNPQGAIQSTAQIYETIRIEYHYSTTVDNINYEVVDIPGLMLSILGMPFAWISTAFNLTIFPGTPYAVNISHIFMAVIGALILIVILKKLLK